MRDGHVRRRTCSAIASRADAIGVENGLFDEEYAALARAPRHQVLRPLKDEIPAEMRKTDQVRDMGDVSCDMPSPVQEPVPNAIRHGRTRPCRPVAAR